MNQNPSITGQINFEKHGLSLTDSDQAQAVANHSIELKERCIQQVHHALDTYHHEGMGTQELKTIVRNVIENRVEIPQRMQA